MERQNFYILVTYAGTLPFLACVLMLYTGINELGLLGDINQLASIYALIIVSFIAGIHLGTYLFYNTQTPKFLFIVSNIVAALVWLTALSTSSFITFLIPCLAFTYLLFVDYLLRREKFISLTYFSSRVIVTLISVIALLFTASVS